FLADRRCQNVINNEWLGSWADWNFCSRATRAFRVSLHTIFFFAASFLYIVTINRLPGSCRIPYARFLSSLFAHLLFIGCIVFNMQWDEPRDLRGLPDAGLKLFVLVYIWLYVFGEYFVLVTDLWRLGFRRYFDAWWHWYENFIKSYLGD
uniref:Uncharacterized protein n=1 Tax=Romanomermis culicivorax TaxID=13658 RepID=A0A915JNH3_ROMCU